MERTKKIFDDDDEETLLILLVHGATDGPNSPAESVQVLPAPLSTVHLFAQLLRQYSLSVHHIQVGQVYESLSHRLVKVNRVRVLITKENEEKNVKIFP